MSTNKRKQSEIKFDQNWRCCSTDNIDIDVITNKQSNENLHWISIQLPDLIDKTKAEINQSSSKNRWYYKQFQWKTHFQDDDDDQRVSLVFKSLEDQKTDEHKIDDSPTDTLTVWFNGIKIFDDSFQSPRTSLDLTKHLIYKDDSDKTNRQNTLIVCCKNASLSFHTYLLVPHGLTGAIEQDDGDAMTEKTSQKLPLRRNRVLDFLVGFNGSDGRFDVGFNPILKWPMIAKLPNPSHTIAQENGDDASDRISNTSISGENHTLDYLININHANDGSSIDSNAKINSPTPSNNRNPPDIIISEENTTELHVPRLNIVMLVVGTRGDVQPFVAFGQTLLGAGHRVRLATHEKFRKYVREYDLEFYPLASNPDDLMSFMVQNGGIVPSMNSIFKGEVKRKRRDLANILHSTWLACTENDDETSMPFTADVIIANPPSFGHVHCAQKLQIPLHMIFTMPWSPTTVFPNAFCRMDYSKIPKEKLNLLSYSIVDALTWSGMSGLANDFRRETLDLPPLHTRQAIRMLINERVPHTYCWSPSVVPQPFDWPPYINVAGYFFLKEDKKQFQPPDDLIAFLDLNNENGEKLAPPIYIGFGSITGNDSKRLLQVILGALEKTGYRALLSGFDKENSELPDTILKISDTPHDWLFQHVSAVCHHGGAGTVAAGLRAGKPSIIIPFFGDQFFWGSIVAKNGAGPLPLPGEDVTIDELADAFKEAHKQKIRVAAERIRDALVQEDGCASALRMFHSHLPLSRMRSDLEPTFSACYRVDEFDLQVSRPVAQVLIAAGVLDESQFRSHPTQNWASIYDNNIHVPTRGVFKHTPKALSHIFIQSAGGLRRAASSTDCVVGLANGVGDAVKNIGQGVGHLSVGVLSLYGELTDVLERVPSLYGRYNAEADGYERPRVTDFKSGVKAAGLTIEHGWKDGLTGVVKTPRIGYRRHGLLGGATGALVASANVIVKPAVGSFASLTWLGRGMYASITKKKKKRKEEHVLFSSSSSSDTDEKAEQQQENDDISANIKFAAVVSGYSADVCQQILDEFEKVKKYQEEIAAAIPSNENQKHQHRFRRHRRDSDSAL